MVQQLVQGEAERQRGAAIEEIEAVEPLMVQGREVGRRSRWAPAEGPIKDQADREEDQEAIEMIETIEQAPTKRLGVEEVAEADRLVRITRKRIKHQISRREQSQNSFRSRQANLLDQQVKANLFPWPYRPLTNRLNICKSRNK